MRIRTLLVAGTVFSGAVVATVLAYIYVAAGHLDTSLARDRVARNIIVALFEQSEMLSDYVLHPGERARSQWRKKQDDIGRVLDSLNAQLDEESPLRARMEASHRKKADSFAGLLDALRQDDTAAAPAGIRNELQEHRVAQIRLESQAMLSLASLLGQQAAHRLRQTLYELAWGVAVLVIGIVGLLAGLWFILGWRVVRPIGRLQEAIRKFTGGRLEPDAWEGIRKDDEIGDVAHAFERMAENLNSLMVSRNELAKEVETRRQAERQAQEAAASLKSRTLELDAVNKELEAFAYSVSHDLRAPLRSISGFCHVLLETHGNRLDETGKDYMGRIAAASSRMGQLIDDLLTLSRVARTEVARTDIDMSDMAESIAEQLRQVDPDRQVEFRIQPGVVARGDGTLLRTVMENLLENAWKYSAQKPNAIIEFGRSGDGSEVSYFVRDDGAGFDMSLSHRLFKPFQRLHRASEFEGTGIGLASAANIVRRHGGRIWADSMPGAGTTMSFTLSQAA